MGQDRLGEVGRVLRALYLAGGPRAGSPIRRHWPQVVRRLRSLASLSDWEVPGALREDGLWEEAAVLEGAGLLEWAEVQTPWSLTVLDDAYPRRWIERLGAGAPPAVWARPGFPSQADITASDPLRDGFGSGEVRWIGVVGSRCVEDDVLRFAIEVAEEAIQLGFGVVSGGAVGCDTGARFGAAAQGGRLLTLLPCGLFQFPCYSYSPSAARRPRVLEVSLSACNAPFSTAAAMERNFLTYAAAEATVVVHARLKAGGGWHGATTALRRRVGAVLVRKDPGSPAHEALIALGGQPVSEPAELGSVLRSMGIGVPGDVASGSRLVTGSRRAGAGSAPSKLEEMCRPEAQASLFAIA